MNRMIPRIKKRYRLVAALALLLVLAVVARVVWYHLTTGPPSPVTASLPNVGLFPAQVDIEDGHRFGFIDREGRVVIAPEFLGAGNFSEGLAPVARKVEKDRYGAKPVWGFIDAEGEFVIPPKYESAEPFSGGMAEVQSGFDSTGYINREGKWVIRPVISRRPYWRIVDGNEFVKGRAVCSLTDNPFGPGSSSTATAVIDVKGSILEWLYVPVVLESAVGQETYLSRFQYYASAAYVDVTNRLVLPLYPTTEIKEFADGMTAVAKRLKVASLDEREIWGYADTSGTLRIDYQYEKARPFYKGRAWVETEQGDWKAIDKDGNLLSTAEQGIRDIFPFSEDRALVVYDIRYGVMDVDGNIVPVKGLEYDSTTLRGPARFHNGLIELLFKDCDDSVQVYVDRSGKIVWESNRVQS